MDRCHLKRVGEEAGRQVRCIQARPTDCRVLDDLSGDESSEDTPSLTPILEALGCFAYPLFRDISE
jgi:hypothetical protein